jgi:hypothetical protein
MVSKKMKKSGVSWSIGILSTGCCVIIALLYFFGSAVIKNISFDGLLTFSTEKIVYNYDFTPAYSIWLRPPKRLAKDLQSEVYSLARRFNGTFHNPHVTLGGPFFTTNESYVVEVATKMADKLRPFKLEFDSIQSKKYIAHSRFPSLF